MPQGYSQPPRKSCKIGKHKSLLAAHRSNGQKFLRQRTKSGRATKLHFQKAGYEWKDSSNRWLPLYIFFSFPLVQRSPFDGMARFSFMNVGGLRTKLPPVFFGFFAPALTVMRPFFLAWRK